MEQNEWKSIKDEMPPEKKAVHIYVNDKLGLFNIYTAHHEEKVWFIYDPFTRKFRIYNRQQYVSHWMPLLPSPMINKIEKESVN